MRASNIFQHTNSLQKSSFLSNTFGQHKSVLNEALERINENILKNSKSEVKPQYDIYIPEYNKEQDSALAKFSDDEVEMWSMVFRCRHNTVDSDIETFREQLKGIDQTIQDYEKMLSGEIAMTKASDGTRSPLGSTEAMTKQEVETLLAETKAFRDEFIKKNIDIINRKAYGISGYVGAGGLREQGIKRILGENPVENLDNSVWSIDINASDIYAELDKVQKAAKTTCNVIEDCESRIRNEMIRRNLGKYVEYFKAEKQEEPEDYIKKYENMLQLELDRLSNNFVSEQK